MPLKYRDIFAKFRTSTHNIMLEKGRHLGLDRESRLCLFCRENDLYVVKTEFHFLFECTLYDELRHSCNKCINFKFKSVDNFNRILSLSEAQVNRMLTN